jgi:WD40 repeat protein
MVSTSSVDGTVKLWRATDGALVRTLKHPAGVTSVAWTDDGQWIVSGSYDGMVRVWRAHDGALVRTLRGHEGTVWSVAVDRGIIASSGEDKTARLWRLTDGAALRTLRGHTLNVWHVTFHPDGRTLATSSFDKTIRIWRVADGALLSTITGHSEAVVATAFSPDGRFLASGSDDSTVRIWTAKGVAVRTIDATNHAYSVAFSPDSAYLAAGTRELSALGTLWKQVAGPSTKRGVSVRIWRVRDAALVQTLAAQDDVMSVAFSPDGKWLATSSEDGSAKLWRLTEGPRPR